MSAAAYHSLGLALRAVADLEGAEEAFRKALELASQRIATRAQLAVTLLRRGRPAEALEQAALEPEAGHRLWALALSHLALADVAAADGELKRLTAKLAEGWALQIAEIHAVRGRRDAAFIWLERAFATRDPGLVHVGTDAQLDSLHDDPRWDRFLRRPGLDRKG